MHRVAQWPWASPLVRWHARHVMVIWLGVRVLLTMALAGVERMSDAPPMPLSELLAGASATFVTFALTMLLAAIDRRRIGAPLLFANLGFSAWWFAITTGAIAITAELMLRLALRVVAGVGA